MAAQQTAIYRTHLHGSDVRILKHPITIPLKRDGAMPTPTISDSVEVGSVGIAKEHPVPGPPLAPVFLLFGVDIHECVLQTGLSILALTGHVDKRCSSLGF